MNDITNIKILACFLLIVAIATLLWMYKRSRKLEGVGAFEITYKDKKDFKKFGKEFAQRKVLAQFAGGLGHLILLSGLYAIFKDKSADWKVIAGMMCFGAVLIAFAISLIKDGSAPLAVHFNRIVFFAYGILFAMITWRGLQENLHIVPLIGGAFTIAGVAGVIASFSRAAPVPWVLAAIQIAFVVLFATSILRSHSSGFWGHPIVAVGFWAAIILLLIIGLFGKESRAYYAVQFPKQTGQLPMAN